MSQHQLPKEHIVPVGFLLATAGPCVSNFEAYSERTSRGEKKGGKKGIPQVVWGIK